MRKSLAAATAGGVLVAGLAASPTIRFYRDRRTADRMWQASVPEPFEHPGTVDKLTILPLIDYYAAADGLVGEPGVSYLIRADDLTILFDVGYNGERKSPSPLVRNMETLGVSRDEIDVVFISHRHIDHTGGLAAQKAKTFMLTPDAPEALPVEAYVPVEMSHPSARVKVVTDPLAIAPGVFSIGRIARSLWLMGLTYEQALAVNVQGKGIVLIIGCGHQTLERAVARTEALFDAPLFGVIGGLHLPVTASRMAHGAQRFIGTGNVPWRRIRKEDVRSTVRFLEQKDPQLVGISAHDSCDWSLGVFRDAFGDRYRDVAVGDEIVV